MSTLLKGKKSIPELIKDLTYYEEKEGLYNEQIFGFSFWRIIRSNVIDKYLHREYGIGLRDSLKKRVNIGKLSISVLKSSWQIFKLFTIKYTNIDNIFFAFPRLQKVNGYYIDKFTDPLIEFSKLKNNYLIFQRPLAGIHKTPRYNSDKIIITDLIEFVSKVFGVLLIPIIQIVYFPILFRTFQKGKKLFNLHLKDFIIFSYKLSSFYLSYKFYTIILKTLLPKNVFFVSRELNYPLISASRKFDITTYELQHGVTHTWTVLYSGKYDPNIDPDFFLTFGEIWKGKQFGLPVDKIYNLGWAYNEMLMNNSHLQGYSGSEVLVISQPGISESIIAATLKLAQSYVDFQFHIRLHPQEEVSHKIKKLIEKQQNLVLVDNTIESSVSLMPYELVLGVNSSVLYEAVSLQKNVGLLNFEGCIPNFKDEKVKEAFWIIKEPKDFDHFKERRAISEKTANMFYSEFNQSLFNEIIS